MNELRTAAKLENIDIVFAFFETNMLKEGCTSKDINSMRVVAEEVFVNIANYAYAPNEGNVVIRMDMRRNPTQLLVEFEDEGKPYNPLENPEPDITMDVMDRPIGGLGIFLVKNIMDDVQYEFSNGKNKLTMKKTFDI